MPTDEFDFEELRRQLLDRLQPSLGQRPGRPTDSSWDQRPKIPMSKETLQKLRELASDITDRERRISPMQVAALLLENAVKDYASIRPALPIKKQAKAQANSLP